MKKTGISVILALGAVVYTSCMDGARAAYPVYNGYAAPGYIPAQNVVTPQYLPQNAVIASPAAAPVNRVTGALPRVGTNAAMPATARQYYNPNNFDRLSESGLYIGLSVAYSASVNGGMLADYRNEPGSATVPPGFAFPGAFQTAKYKTDTVLPLSISVGAAINSDLRVDFSYLRYSGLSYPDTVQTGDGIGGFYDVPVTGGGITSNTTMLNLYYNLDSFTGSLSGGSIRPYIGVGVGISLNTISDYLVFDGGWYPQVPTGTIGLNPGDLTAISDIYAYHSGGTTEQFAYMAEGGITTELDGGLKLDLFVRYMNLGKVQSSGSIVISQTDWVYTGQGAVGDDGSEVQVDFPDVQHQTNWYESGRLGTVDVGVRLRLQF